MVGTAEDPARIEQLEAEVRRLRERDTATQREIAALREENYALREQQTAVAEILRAIAESPASLQAVFDSIVSSAVRLCEADLGLMQQIEGTGIYSRATTRQDSMSGIPMPLDASSVSGRAIFERRTITAYEPRAEHQARYPNSRMYRNGFQSQVAVPLVRGGTVLGTMAVLRRVREPFDDRQIALLEAFADQAVIAIESARLFEELEWRNHELHEALEQQTATGEVLGVIASSPSDVQPVLETVAHTAARLCDADNVAVYLPGDGKPDEFGDIRLQLAASLGEVPPILHGGRYGVGPVLTRDSVAGRAWLERRQIQVEDLTANADEYPRGAEAARRFGHHTTLATPLLRQGEPLGVIVMYRREVRAFADPQLALLRTFADQAVIAIENARLFQEL